MLILTRKSGQELILDGQIRIRVLCTRPGSVRLGIEAPDEVSVFRGELDLVGRLFPQDEPAEVGHAPQRLSPVLR